MTVIIFYHMQNCGYCSKAEKELQDLIADGTVVKKDASEAPSGTTGFPTFQRGDVIVTGYKPREQLLKALGASEGFSDGSNGPIIFFSMEGCGYCKKAMEVLKHDIANGDVVVKSASEAPAGTTGFPTFQRGEVIVAGYMPREQLFDALGVSEGFTQQYEENFGCSVDPSPPQLENFHYPPYSFGYRTLGNYWS